MNSKIFKKVFPHVFVALTFCLTTGLGIWQVERMQWKDALLAKLDSRMKMQPISASEFQNIDSDEFRLLREHGKFDSAQKMEVLLRAENGKVGNFEITPFISDSGQVVLVNRGWVPNEEEFVEADAGNELYGVIRQNPRKGYFTLKNAPEKNIWYNINLPEMYTKIGAKELPYYVEARAQNKHDEQSYPIPLPKHIDIYNEHLQYIITWFGMSIVLLVTYYFRFFHDKKKSKKK